MSKWWTIVAVVTVQAGGFYLSLFGLAAVFRQLGLDVRMALAAAVATLGCAGLLLFWLAYLVLPSQAPTSFARSYYILGLVAVAGWALHRGFWKDEIAVPVLLAFLATAALVARVHGGTDLTSPLHDAATVWTQTLPGDNRIPLDFARGLASGAVPSPLHATWLSSDRPPLQTGMYLATPGVAVWGMDEFAYQVASVGFQMLVLVGVWVLARALSAPKRLAGLACAATFFTPMVLVNGIFVWPKLLGAAMLCLAVAVHFYGGRATIWHGGIVGALCALAMLSHGVVVFTLIAMAISALLLRRVGARAYVVGAAAAAIALYAPWVAYQRFADPPGTRLVKSSLAGIRDVDARPLSQAIADSYRPLSFDAWLEVKRSNVGLLTRDSMRSLSTTLDAVRDVARGRLAEARAKLAKVRMWSFFGVIAGTGLLGLSLLLVLPSLLDSTLRPTSAVIGLSFVLWWALMFAPRSAIIHQGSYFMEVAAIPAAVVWTGVRSLPVAGVLVVAHAAVSIVQYSL